ncbi:MAG TPA: LuxR C-terminal-related transcriptional regulator [Thermoanaerobaculia bacterium]
MEIALQLGISEKTVHSHRGRMLKKLGVSDMRELMLYAMRNGLTDWAPLEINAD